MEILWKSITLKNPYFDFCYSSREKEINPPFVPEIKIEPGTEGPRTEGTESPPVTQSHGQRHPVLGSLSYSQHHHPVGTFPYSQQDPFLEEEENIPDAPGGDDDEEEEQEEEHVVQNQQVFCIGKGIILDNIYCPDVNHPKEKFHLEELLFFIMLPIQLIKLRLGGFLHVPSLIIVMPVPREWWKALEPGTSMIIFV